MEARLVSDQPSESGAVTGADAVPGAKAELARLFEDRAAELVGALTAAGYADAADAVQEAFVQAIVHWRRVSRYDDPLAWVRRVAVNKARNRFRSRRRQHALADRIAQRRSPPPGVDEVTDRETDGDVTAAVNGLPGQQRLAVSLFYYADLSVVQVAAAMNVSEGTVKSHLHAARAAVATALERSS
jgi:RNA polymerase sigma-70 factor (ECF subfamily)